MKKSEYIRQIDFDNVNDILDVDYRDEGIAFIRKMTLNQCDRCPHSKG